ncbi:MAG: hypothetical protein ACOYEJ_04890 [Mahellales bacterium]
MEKRYKTGQRCKESGLYECQISGENKHFNEGEQFPQCSKGRDTIWQKVEK